MGGVVGDQASHRGHRRGGRRQGYAEGRPGVGWTGFPGTSGLALDKTAFPDDGRSEPRPALASHQTRFAEAPRLDLTRVGLGPKPRPAKRRFPYGPIGSFLVHLLPFLLLVEWPSTPPEIEMPIPIQLVIEQPPPQPAPQPAETKPPAKPPPGRRASDDFGDPDAPKVEPPKTEPSQTEAGKSDPPPQKAERPSSATETQTAMTPPSTSSAPPP